MSPGGSLEHWLRPVASNRLPFWASFVTWELGILIPPQGPLIFYDRVTLPEPSLAPSWGVPRKERGEAGIKIASLRLTWVRGGAGR